MSEFKSLKNLNGWFIGKFKPTLIESNEVEVGVKLVKKGTKPDNHYHKIKTEYTIIIQGSIRVGNMIFNEMGDCLILKPYEKNDHEFLEDTTILIINDPSATDDKYY